ncbi:MAG: hypothetical protein IPM97_07805 [Bdellovibrionaceae bacterium]|nr:hypothetical protein [Pseudobdellovibrionaceae bacterium]
MKNPRQILDSVLVGLLKISPLYMEERILKQALLMAVAQKLSDDDEKSHVPSFSLDPGNYNAIPLLIIFLS